MILLRKGLYGLKQSANLWYYDAKLTLNKFGLKCAQSDACLFIGRGIYVIMHVDDFQISSKDALLNSLRRTALKRKSRGTDSKTQSLLRTHLNACMNHQCLNSRLKRDQLFD